MRTRVARLVAVIAVLAAGAPIVAHHSFAAQFDASKPLKLTGVVTKMESTNPHAWFWMDVTDENGKVTNWGIEFGSPNGLMRQGWTRKSPKPGDSVTIEGTHAKDGSHTGNARSVILSTGQRLFAASSQGVTP